MFTQSSTICVFIFWVWKPINGFQSPLFYCKKNTLPWTLLYYRILRTHQSVHNIVFTLIATTTKCCFFQRVWCVSFIQAEKQTNNSLWYYNFEEKEKKLTEICGHRTLMINAISHPIKRSDDSILFVLKQNFRAKDVLPLPFLFVKIFNNWKRVEWNWWIKLRWKFSCCV